MSKLFSDWFVSRQLDDKGNPRLTSRQIVPKYLSESYKQSLQWCGVITWNHYSKYFKLSNLKQSEYDQVNDIAKQVIIDERQMIYIT